MNRENAIFISNSLYFNENLPAGGVKLCTNEFIDVLKIKFNLIFFSVNFRTSIIYRLGVRLGLNAYNDYNCKGYVHELSKIVLENNIKYIFLNLSNTIKFAKDIHYISSDIKIILCSHGNESGDYMHSLVIYKQIIPFYKRLFGNLTLGKMITTESEYRNKYINLVLTVSQIEESIEKWLGSPLVYTLPRVVYKDVLTRNPIPGKIGFIGDLTHLPNYFGIETLCKELLKLNSLIEIRLVGTSEQNGTKLQKLFPFVSYLGYLKESELRTEVSTWAFSINPVFYYSRGVSTKVAKALGWGVPVISTTKGIRGYEYKEGNMLLCNSAIEMARLIESNAFDSAAIDYYQKETVKIIDSTPTLEELIGNICQILLI